MSDQLWVNAIALAGVAVGAFAGGAVGLGFPVVAVPALTLGYGLETAVVVASIPTFAIDLANLHRTRHERPEKRDLVVFGMLAMAGTLIGALVRGSLNERVLVAVLAATLAIYLALEILPRIDLRRLVRAPGVGPIAGSTAGFLQSAVGVSGPVVGMYWLNRTETRTSFIFHITTAFCLMGPVRIVGLAAVGLFTAERLVIGIGLAVVGVALRTVGYNAGERLDRDRFRKAVLLLMAASLVPLLLRTF